MRTVMQVDLLLTPMALAKVNLEHKTAVVIDVLRSSTSTCAALEAGAKAVIPSEGPGEAGQLWTKLGSDLAILAGERNGVKIDNFMLGNSPSEFTPEVVKGKIIIMTTTNGTQIFAKSISAGTVLAGALVNIAKVAEKVAAENQGTVIICSGREGNFSMEDTLCGGLLIHLLQAKHKLDLTLNDAANLALLLYRTNANALKQAIRQGEHGKFLASIGFDRDVDLATEVDSIPVLPILHDGRLILAENA